MKNYAVMIGVFVLMFGSIQATVYGYAPHTLGYILFAVVFVAGVMAYRRHQSRYVRSMYATVIPVQLLFQVALPYWVFQQTTALNHPWPFHAEVLWGTGTLVVYYFVLSFLILPVLVLLFGRRAWCSFTCSLGALAETLGDPHRTRGAKSRPLPAGFVVTKWVILAGTLAATALALFGYSRVETFEWVFLIIFILFLRAFLSLAVNVLFMPRLGTRIWCKYFCPQGLVNSILHRFSRFALVRDDALCRSCGTCSKHCSMAIDITAGPAINRTGNCVGCGVCVEVCPQQALSMRTGRLPIPAKDPNLPA